MDDRRKQSGSRFVLLRHEMPQTATRGSHWDFMLENGGVLLTWEFPELPMDTPPTTFPQLGIRRLPDHRLEYLAYEGPISNDRGRVQRVDEGVYRLSPWHKDSDLTRVLVSGNRFEIELLLPVAIFVQADEFAGERPDLDRLSELLTFGIINSSK